MGFHSFKMPSLRTIGLNDLCVIIILWLLSFKFLVKICWRHLLKAHVGHMHRLVEGVSSQLVLPIIVVQVRDVVVADAGSLVILAAEEDARLG